MLYCFKKSSFTIVVSMLLVSSTSFADRTVQEIQAYRNDTLESVLMDINYSSLNRAWYDRYEGYIKFRNQSAGRKAKSVLALTPAVGAGLIVVAGIAACAYGGAKGGEKIAKDFKLGEIGQVVGAVRGAEFGAQLGVSAVEGGAALALALADQPLRVPAIPQEYTQSPLYNKNSLKGESYRVAVALNLLNYDQLKKVYAAFGDIDEYTFYGRKGEGLTDSQKRRLRRTLTNKVFSDLLVEAGYSNFPNIFQHQETPAAVREGEQLFNQLVSEVSHGNVEFGFFSKPILDFETRVRPDWYSKFLR